MQRSTWQLLFVAFCAASLGCTQTLTDADCARHRDRLLHWAEQRKGKHDRKPIDDFMKSCAGTTVSRATARCLDRANDEQAFFKCLE